MKKADRNKKGMIFNIQKFSVNDGPGIRTVVFFKGCPLHCRWCSNPESQLFKMQVLHERKKCAHCLHCINICPVFAINLVKEDIRIDASLCNGCKKCTVECPQRALEMAGYEKTVQDVIDVVLQDKVFYEEGGGITLSGGEFLAQSDFAMELLLAAKEENLHTCCETTGFARCETFNKFIPFIDYFLFDIKHWNKEKHIEGTGVSNELPLNNLKTVFQAGKTVLPRIPVIHGFNDSLKDATEFSALLHEIGIKKCQLLPFHQFGENKYRLLDKSYDYEDVPSLHKEDLEEYLSVFYKYNINAFF